MKHASLAALLLVIGCGGSDPALGGDDTTGDPDGGTGSGSDIDAPVAAGPRTVFVIPFENKSSAAIYGNTADAPYINGLLASVAHSTNFGDALPSLPSEPHYVWMEGGTNAFSDKTFTSDSDASNSNSTTSTVHLVTQLTAANIPWMSYQEGITAGKCPISSTGHYAAKHDPFVFFKDVVGSPPSASNTYCAQHHKPYSDFVTDLGVGLDGYVFITPDLCHDMHGAFSCPSGLLDSDNIAAGDAWLQSELPRIIDYTKTHDAIVFLTWDEGDSSNLIPFIAIGKHVKAGYISTTAYTHSSLVKSIELYLGVPELPMVTAATAFTDMFEAGTFP